MRTKYVLGVSEAKLLYLVSLFVSHNNEKNSDSGQQQEQSLPIDHQLPGGKRVRVDKMDYKWAWTGKNKNKISV